MDVKDLYCQSVGSSKVCRDRFGTECRTINNQQLDVRRNIHSRSCNHYCSRKAISITYSVCVFVALDTQSKMLMGSIIF